MATFLLTWNPNRWDWDDRRDLQGCIATIEEQGCCEDRWSCGRNRRIQTGDRLFLMRLGREPKGKPKGKPKGIVASGFATSDVYEDDHWEAEHTGTALYVELNFDVLLDSKHEPILSLSDLEDISASMTWTPQGSGITVQDEIASKLEASWLHFLSNRAAISPPQEVRTPTVLYEGATQRITVNAYERNPGFAPFPRTVCL